MPGTRSNPRIRHWLFVGSIVLSLAVAAPANAERARLSSIKLTSKTRSHLLRLNGGVACYQKNSNHVLAGRVKRVKGRSTFVPLKKILDDRLKELGKRLSRKKLRARRKLFKSRIQSERAQCRDALSGEFPGEEPPTSDPRTGPGPGPGPDPDDPDFTGNLSFGDGMPWNSGPGVRFRWYPAANATGYYLYIYRSDGTLYSKSPMNPNGCKHTAFAGYNAGACSVILSGSSLPLGYSAAVSAFNSDGESAPRKF